MEVHFPGSRDSSTTAGQAAIGLREYKPKAWPLAVKIVQPCKVRWVIKTFEPFKAPGMDGIYPVLLQKGFDILLVPLLNEGEHRAQTCPAGLVRHEDCFYPQACEMQP